MPKAEPIRFVLDAFQNRNGVEFSVPQQASAIVLSLPPADRCSVPHVLSFVPVGDPAVSTGPIPVFLAYIPDTDSDD